MSKVDRFNTIIKDNEHYPEQGSPEWDRQRKEIIGGSEMKEFKKRNHKFSNLDSLYRRKIGIERVVDNIVMLQGHFFEDISKVVIKFSKKVDIADMRGPIPS